MQDEVSSADSVTNGRPIHNRNPEAGNPRQCWLWLGERSRAQQRKRQQRGEKYSETASFGGAALTRQRAGTAPTLALRAKNPNR